MDVAVETVSVWIFQWCTDVIKETMFVSVAVALETVSVWLFQGSLDVGNYFFGVHDSGKTVFFVSVDVAIKL